MSAHVTDRLSAYLDGALPASVLARVQAHLEQCAPCARAYEELRALRGLLRALPDPAEPAGLADRIHWRLARDLSVSSPRRSAWRSVWAAWTQPLAARPVRLALAAVMLAVIMGLPMEWVSGVVTPHGASFDPDAYIRDYLLLSSDRLTDDVTRTVIAHTALPESTAAR